MSARFDAWLEKAVGDDFGCVFNKEIRQFEHKYYTLGWADLVMDEHGTSFWYSPSSKHDATFAKKISVCFLRCRGKKAVPQ